MKFKGGGFFHLFCLAVSDFFSIFAKEMIKQQKNMDRQTQDRNWNNLTEEKKNEYRDLYQKGLNYVRNEDGYLKGLGQGELNVIVDVFGEDNLLTRSAPKTWESVIKCYPEHFSHSNAFNPKIVNPELSDTLLKRTEAMYKIATLIDLGYGGMVSEEEWKDINCRKYTISYYPQDGRKFVTSDYGIGEFEFLAFHSARQRDEFWKYESNRQLVKQYFMALGK